MKRKKNKTDGGKDQKKNEDSGKEQWNLGREKKEGERDACNKVDALICFSIWMHPTDQSLD